MDYLPDALHALPGTFGSALSVLWLRDPSKGRKFVYFIGGAVIAHFSSKHVAPMTHLEDGFLLCFLLGLGSMCTIAKVFETVQDINLGAWVRDILRDVRDMIRKKGGLPPAPPDAVQQPPTKE